MHIKKYNNLNKDNILCVIIILSIFIFSQEFRSVFGYKFYNFNILGITSIFILLYKNMNNINKRKLVFFYLSVIVYIMLSAFYEKNISNIIAVVLLFMAPLALTLIELNEKNLPYILKYMVIVINIITIIMVIIGILDNIIGTNINLNLSRFMSEGTRSQIIANSQNIIGKRMYSFMGHPLYNTEIILMCYILNILYKKYIQKSNCSLLILIFSATGIALTGSKTGFILFLVTTLIMFRRKNKVSKYLIIFIGAIVAIKIQLFNTVLERFANGNITTGRSDKWEEIKNLNVYPLRFFLGYGKGFTNEMSNYIQFAYAAYEYPIRMFSLELGMLTTILIYMFIMIFPIITLCSRKQWYLLCAYLIIFIDVNTYNGMACSGDKMMLFCLFIFIILNLSKYVKYNSVNI